MLVVLPLVPASPADLVLLRGQPGEGPPALRLARRLLDAGLPCRACVSDAGLARLLAEGGVPVARLPEAGYAPYREGLRLAVQTLLDQGALGPDTPVVAANPRFASLAPGTIAGCLEDLAGGEAVASFAPARPHPVQLFRAHRIAELDLLVFREPGAAARALLDRAGLAAACGLSRPFHFDWRGAEREGACVFTVTVCPHGTVAGLAPEPDPAGALAAGRRVLLRESPLSARRLLPAGGPPEEAASALRLAAPTRLRLRREAGADVLSDAAGRGPCLVRAWPVVGDALGALQEREFPAGGWELRLEAGAPGAERPDAWFAALLTPPENGLFDHAEHLPGGTLWSLDPVTDRPADPATGQPFCNRQEFPALETPDEALFAGTAARLLSREPGLGWRALRLPEPERRRLGTPLDLLRAGRGPNRADKPEAAGPAEPTSPAAKPQEAGPEAVWQARAEAETEAEAEVAWSCRRLLALLGVLRQGPDPSPERLLGVLRTRCAARLAALTTAQARERARSCGAARPAELPPPAWPGAPAGLRLLSSDGGGMLYACARTDRLRWGLFALDLRGGAVRELGRAGAEYSGVWFDPRQALVYAYFYRDADGGPPGFDVFRADGRHAHRERPVAEGEGPRLLSRLQGNAASLFLMDYAAGEIVELDKATFRRRAAHRLGAGLAPSDFRCSDGHIDMALLHESALARLDLSGGGPRLRTGGDLLLPSLLERAPDGRLALVALERATGELRPLEHWLKTFDPDLNLLSCAALGPMYARSMALFDDGRRVALADQCSGLRCFDLAGGGLRP